MISAVAYGSLGEILQGRYKGIDVLCSFPVNLFTRVYLTEDVRNTYEYVKTNSFIKEILMKWEIEEKYFVLIESNIPKMKGFASSTADILAAYIALLKRYKRIFNIEELVKTAIKIEPTDSIIFDKATLFDYKEGKYIRTLGDYFKFYCICFEGIEGVDTLSFNKSAKVPLQEVDDLVELLDEAIKNKSAEKLAYVSTQSILRNQKRLPYLYLNDILDICKKVEGLGIVGAHSGNMISIIFDDKEKRDFYMERIDYKMNFYPLETLRKDEIYEVNNDISIK
ncbi:MAG: kinase [Caloramator sp.]|nr:MAG: kinase [Caloramator sp.]